MNQGLTVKLSNINPRSAIRHNIKTATLVIIKPKTMSLVLSPDSHDLLHGGENVDLKEIIKV